MIAAAAALLAALLGSPAPAQAPPMIPAEEAGDWRGVGRLNAGGNRFCTATLIAADVALTAAHCLFHPRTGAATALSELRFVAAPRPGGPLGWSRVLATALPDAYRYQPRPTLDNLALDVAVVRLETPFAAETAPPFLTAPPAFPASGAAALSIVSYRRDRAHAPSMQLGCPVLVRTAPVSTLGCGANNGASGGPVFADFGEGPRVVAIISAMLESPDGVRAVVIDAEPLASQLQRRLGR